MTKIVGVCPGCGRDVALYADRRLELRSKRHRTPLGKRCAASKTRVDPASTYVLRG